MGDSKVALVTGSTSGIGLTIVRALAKRGVNIIVTGFADETTINAILAEIKGYGVRADYIAADITKVPEIEALWSKLVELYPDGVDILINNAGGQRMHRIEEYSDENWDFIIAVNLSSTFHFTKRALPLMKKKGWGRIVNMSSSRAIVSAPTAAPYSAAKAGVIGFTKGTALENGDFGITCNAVCPGIVLTPPIEERITQMKAQRPELSRDQIEAIMTGPTASHKFIEPEQIADLVEFLCLSHASSQMTGAAYLIDSGYTAA